LVVFFFASTGILFATAGHVAGLPRDSTAGGEVFGGVSLIVASFILFLLFASTRPREKTSFTAWFGAASVLLGIGIGFVANGLYTTRKTQEKVDEARRDLRTLKQALDAYEAKQRE
jgi:cellobiose-specific phosphotransferase system component IIC